MDGRKAFILAGSLLCGLAGCTKSVTTPNTPPTPPPPPKAAQLTPSSDSSFIKREPLGEPKPATWVQMAALKTELATDLKRSAEEREVFAQQAKDAYAKALKGDPKYVPAYMGLGYLNEALGEREEAMANYRRAMSLDPKNAKTQVTAYVSIARVLEQGGKRDEALATYAAATTAMPKEAALWYEMGMCYGRAKLFDQAVPCLAKACELRPKYTDYAKATGFMLARMGRDDEALQWLMQVWSEANARYNLALMMHHIGRDDVSREQLTASLQIDPNHPGALKMMTEDFAATAAPATPAAPVPTTAPVRTVSVPADDTAAPIQQATTLPTRPMAIRTASAEPRPLPPMIPVVSEQFEVKSLPPSLTGPAPRVECKKPTVTIGFESTP